MKKIDAFSSGVNTMTTSPENGLAIGSETQNANFSDAEQLCSILNANIAEYSR
tara:strand:- start:2861 stop:3019 length:159 start_codon:yes stop_codon:yes gene_type:complete